MGSSIQGVSVYMTLLAVGFALAVSQGVKWFNQRANPYQVATGCGAVMALLLLMVATGWSPMVWGLAVFLGFVAALMYVEIISTFSDQVSNEHQGWIMGVTGSVMSVAFVIMGGVSGVLSSLSPSIMLLMSALFFAASTLLLSWFKPFLVPMEQKCQES